MRIAFLGSGNMGEALMRGVIAGGVTTPGHIIACDVDVEKVDRLARKLGIVGTTDTQLAAAGCDVAVVATKPGAVTGLLQSLAQPLSGKLVISIAAGVTTEAMEVSLGAGARVVRAMPNTPALVGAGATAMAPGAHATAADLQVACALFASVGVAHVVTERELDAVTGLSGSGPGYVFAFIEALAAAGVAQGLSAELAQALAIATVHGAGKLAQESPDAPAVLRQRVTSPGGTTAAGLAVMHDRGVADIMAAVVAAATARARELAS